MYGPKHSLASLLRLARRAEVGGISQESIRREGRVAIPVGESDRNWVVSCLTGLAERRFCSRPGRASALATCAHEISGFATDPRVRDAASFSYGLTRLLCGKYTEALDVFRGLLENAESDFDPSLKAAVFGNIASALHALGETDRSLQLYRSSLAVSEAIGDRDGTGADLCNLANVHAALGEADEALELYRKALRIAREVGNRRHQSNHLGNLGAFLLDSGNLTGALECHREALELSLQTRDRRSEAQDRGNVGLCMALSGDLSRGLELINEARDTAVAIGDGHTLDMLDVRAAEVLGFQGHLAAAVALVDRALESARASREPRAVAARLVQRCWLVVEDAPVAAAADVASDLESAIELAQRLREPRTVARARLVQMRVHLLLGLPEVAVSMASMALAGAREVQDKRGEALAMGFLGVAMAGAGQASDGLPRIEEGLRQLGIIGDAMATVRLLLMSGESRRRLQPAEAVTILGVAASRAGELGMRLVDARSRLARGRAFLTLGLVSEAREDMAAAAVRFADLGRDLEAGECERVAQEGG